MTRFLLLACTLLLAGLAPIASADTPPTNAPAATPPAAPALPTDAPGIIFLSTRGFARTSSDHTNKGLEAETLHRHEFPYGAAPGWKWVYQGFSDHTQDTINIKAAGLWIQQSPGDPLTKLPLTFNNGSKTVDIPNSALQETDPIAIEIKPGAVVWVTTWYATGNPATGLPFQTFLCTRESQPGLEDYDGTTAGPIGSLQDQTLKGGFSHKAGAPLSAGTAFCVRGYRPMGALGRPSPAWHGPEIVPLFIGDSINVQYLDCFDDKTLLSMRGWNGRFCAAKYPYMIFGQGGATSGGFTAAIHTPLLIYLIGDNATHPRKVTHLFDEYGINEIRTHNPPTDGAAFEWTARQKAAALAHTYGLPFLQSTLMPCEAHNTVWNHPDNPADAAAFTTFIAQRQLFNTRVRTQSDDAHLPGCIGFWDPCTAVETDPKTGSNAWVKAYRTDGIHPNSAGHAAAAATIPPNLLETHPNPVPQG
jgi:lysophospholipase L1-like esterase